MPEITNYTELGYLPFQHHEPARKGKPPSLRMGVFGARVTRVEQPEDDSSPESSMIEYGAEGPTGTIGDFHPTLFWQTEDKGKRGTGVWTMGLTGLVMGGSTGGLGGGRTGSPPSPAKVRPFRDDEHKTDPRLMVKEPAWPKGLSVLPRGAMVDVRPGMEEDEQHEILVNADNRLFAVNNAKPIEAGTLVCDLQPEGEICMDNSLTPGVGGRHARLQSMMRVVALDTVKGLDVGIGNALAWNMGTSSIDRLAGFGLCWGNLGEGGGGGSTGGPITGTRNSLVTGNAGEGSEERRPHEYGEFKKNRQQGRGLAFMAQDDACGPLKIGGQGDKHVIGADKDGHEIMSGHLDPNAYWHMDNTRDGPLEFTDLPYPEPENLPFLSRVTLGWDPADEHKFLDGVRPGKWKWWAEYDVYVPPPTGGRTPLPPQPPTTGGPPTSGPITPRPPGGPGGGGGGGGGSGPITPVGRTGEPKRGDAVSDAGGMPSNAVGLFETFRPMTSGFAAMSFRPELVVPCHPSYIHNPNFDPVEFERDEAQRPQVMALRTWGGQSESGSWDYHKSPDTSRARGGTTHGGVLLTPPDHALYDYLGSSPTRDVRAATSTSWFAAAPWTGFALGTPTSIGGMAAKSVRVYQTPAGNDPLTIDIVDSSGVGQKAFGAELDQASSELVTELGGHGVRIPSTTTRPTILNLSDVLRIHDTGTEKVMEFYDDYTAKWRQVQVSTSSNPIPTSDPETQFSASGSFSYQHGWEDTPDVTVFTEDGRQIETEVYQLPGMVTVNFRGTLTNATLRLSR